MGRESILADVRQAVETGRPFRVAISAIPENVGYVGASAELPDALANEIRAVGGTAFVVDDDQAAITKVAELIDELKPQSVIGWEHPLLSRLAISELLDQRNISFWSYGKLQSMPLAEQRAEALATDLAISSADWAVAETGSLVVRATMGRERIASLIAPIHLAIVERSQIVADLLDVFSALYVEGVQRLPSNLAFITGPSKTGDIELQLTTGVHGPGTWIVVIIR